MKTEVIEKRESESRWAEIDEASRLTRRLRDELERVRRQRATRAGWRQRYVPTGLAALDAVLPYGGLPSGAITEIFADGPGVGSLSLALRIARRCAESSENQHWRASRQWHPNRQWHPARNIVILDTLKDFYP